MKKSKISKSTETESNLVVAEGWRREKGGVIVNGFGVSSRDDENILKLDSGDYCNSVNIINTN